MLRAVLRESCARLHLMKRPSRLRFFLVLLLTVILLLGGMLYLAWVFLRGRPESGGKGGGSTGSGTGSGMSSRLLRSMLGDRVSYKALDHLGGYRFRLSGLRVMRTGSDKGGLSIPSIDLEVNPTALAVSGFLDAGPVLGGYVTPRLSLIEIPSGTALPMTVTLTPGALWHVGRLDQWSAKLNPAGRSLLLNLHPKLKKVGLQIIKGLFAFEKGDLGLNDLETATGQSKLRLDAQVKSLTSAPMVTKARLGANIRFADFVIPTDKNKAPAEGEVKIDFNMRGDLINPTIDGQTVGAFNIPFLPFFFREGGVRRFAALKMSGFSGQFHGGSPAEGVLMQYDLAARDAQWAIWSFQRRAIFSGKDLFAHFALKRSWMEPLFEHGFKFVNGALDFRAETSEATVGTVKAENAVVLPYESLGVRFAGREAGFDVVGEFSRFLGATGTAGVKCDYTQTGPKIRYSVNLKGLNLSTLSQFLFEPSLKLGGSLDLSGGGTTDELSFSFLKGEGRGTVRGYSLRWDPPEGALATGDLAALINVMGSTETSVQMPLFGNGMILRFLSKSGRDSMLLEINLDTKLEVRGSLVLNIDPGTLASRPALAYSWSRLGLENRVAMKIEGPSGRARLQLH